VAYFMRWFFQGTKQKRRSAAKNYAKNVCIYAPKQA